jgi:FKBP-type peptidyl-prolyl cis-trans isomerase 2
LCRQGGLEVGKVYELRNSGLARVLELSDAGVVLDANNMLAGVERTLEVELIAVERPEK